MEQISRVASLFANDDFLSSIEWYGQEHELELRLVDKALLRKGRFVVCVTVRLLVPTNASYCYLWFSTNEAGNHSIVSTLLEQINEQLKGSTINSIGLVAVISQLLVAFKSHCTEIWNPSSPSAFEISRSDVEQQIIAKTLQNRPKGCQLYLLLLQLAANHGDFERLANPFPEVFKDEHSGRPEIGRLRQTLVNLPCIASLPRKIQSHYQPASKEMHALNNDTALLLFWLIAHAPFSLAVTRATTPNARSAISEAPDGYQIFDISARNCTPDFSTNAATLGQFRVCSNSSSFICQSYLSLVQAHTRMKFPAGVSW